MDLRRAEATLSSALMLRHLNNRQAKQWLERAPAASRGYNHVASAVQVCVQRGVLVQVLVK